MSNKKILSYITESVKMGASSFTSIFMEHNSIINRNFKLNKNVPLTQKFANYFSLIFNFF